MSLERAEIETLKLVNDKIQTVTRYIYFFNKDENDLPKNWRQQNKIMLALAKGRLVYDTGKKIRGNKVFESLNPNTRKLFGLVPLEDLITKLSNLEFIRYHNSTFTEKGENLNV